MNMFKKFAVVMGIFSAFAFISVSTLKAQSNYLLTPWTYDPGNTGTVVSQATANNLHLEKNTATSTEASAGATIYGVDGLSTDELTLSFNVDGYCGAGAPRFNVTLTNGSVIFLGCTHGNDGSGLVTFSSGNTYGGVELPTGQTVKRIDIVMDEEGQTTLSNIMINGDSVDVSPNTLKIQCKNNGWKNFSSIVFKNQGQCVSHFMSNKPTAITGENTPSSMYQSVKSNSTTKSQ